MIVLTWPLAPQIVELKAQLAEAEKNLKDAIQKSEENQRRRAQEEAQDHELLTDHGNKIASVKEALDNAVSSETYKRKYTLANQVKLEDARTNFQGLVFSDLIKRFEEGNMDYSVFKDEGNIQYLVQTYESMQASQFVSDPPKAEQVSHVAGLICSGWYNKPSESPYWRNRTKDTNARPGSLNSRPQGGFFDPTLNSSPFVNLPFVPYQPYTPSTTYLRPPEFPTGHLIHGQIHPRSLVTCQCSTCTQAPLQSNASTESLVYTPATTGVETPIDNTSGGMLKPVALPGTQEHTRNTSTASTLWNVESTN